MLPLLAADLCGRHSQVGSLDLIENSKGVERTDSDQKRKIDGAQRLRTQRSSALWPENFTRNRNSKLVDSLATNGVRGFRHRGQKIGWKAEREARSPIF